MPYEGAVVNCQFCELRGRLKRKTACLEGAGAECGEYEVVEHNVSDISNNPE